MKRYRIDQLKLRPGEDESLLMDRIVKAVAKKKLAGKSRLSKSDIYNVTIMKKSIDGRGGEVHFVYAVDFDCKLALKLSEAPDLTYIPPQHSRTSELRPVVVGFGPCGMFAALLLAREGYRPIVIERGRPVEERILAVEKFWKEGVLDPNSNVQFGEGGAGTFSDGKLNTGIKDPRIRYVLESFVKAGAHEDILIDGRPHIGTDVLRTVVRNIREEILSLGGEIRFGTKLTSLLYGEDGSVTGARTIDLDSGEESDLKTDAVVLAIGHSARDTFRELFAEGVLFEPKPFSIGVRVQHPQELIDCGMYGKDAGNPALPPAYYKLSARTESGRGVYSFCMCPGGEIVAASSQEGGTVVNGMSNNKRDSGFANSAILVDVRVSDFDDSEDPMSGIAFQERYEKKAYELGLEQRGRAYLPPMTPWGEFHGDQGRFVRECLPEFAVECITEAMPHFGKRIPGFDGEDAVLMAVESRSSSPVRILRDRESLLSCRGLYPGGEGAGYAGGITSAACDGIRIAEKIIAGE